jgi:hypothetical protein
MTITILAIAFIVLMLGITALGYRMLTRQREPAVDIHTERCSICRSKYDRSLLVERTIGDTRVLYFCTPCIHALSHDLAARDGTGSSRSDQQEH